MIKNECDIVKDLFPNYIENQVNEGTREFVEKHLKECSDCSNLLNSIKRENDKEIHSSKKEIDFLKIYNIQLMIAKVIIVLLLCIIIPNGSIIGYRFFKGRKAYNIITEACAKKDEFLKEDNFTIEENDNNVTIRKFSIYNDYFKEEKKTIYPDSKDYTRYGKFHENTDTLMLDVSTSDNTISSGGIYGGKYTESQYKVIFYNLDSLLIRDKLNYYNIKVSEEKLKNTDCYVLEETNWYCVSKWYIDTNTMLIIRYEVYGNDGKLQEFCDYSYTINTVKKEEAVITERDGKLIVNGFGEYEYGDDTVWTKNLINEYLK